MNETVKLLQQLIQRKSLTPDDAGCQKLIADYLQPLGFQIVEHNQEGVSNLWAYYGDIYAQPLFVFAGHTDVVPTGEESQWRYAPFDAVIHEQKLYGRGAADMKGAIAAMLTATKVFLEQHTPSNFSLGFLITSDEEGDAKFGMKSLVDYLIMHHIKPRYCVIGEASSMEQVGDAIKVGRRGSLHGHLIVKGQQGHIAYPALAANPIHKALIALDEICKQTWDQGDEHFPETTLQISNVHSGTGALNVIPGTMKVDFNLRYSPAITPEQIKNKIHAILDNHELQYELEWVLSSEPFFSKPQRLAKTTRHVIENLYGYQAEYNTLGGTSDGRFLMGLNCELIELGLINKTIHQVDEHVGLDDLACLQQLYLELLKALFH